MASVRPSRHSSPVTAAVQQSTAKAPAPKETHTRGKKRGALLSCFFSFDASLFRWGAELGTHTTKGGNPKVRRTWIEYTPSLETNKKIRRTTMLLFLGFHCSAQYPPRIDRLAHLGLLYDDDDDDDRLFHKISDTGACTQTLRPRFLIVSTLISVLSRRRRASLSIRQ
jgi:hypothetical protein